MTQRSYGTGTSILIAVGLYLLGDHADTIGQLGYFGWSWAKGEAGRPNAAQLYELSLVTLVFFTALTVVLRRILARHLELDDAAIFIGVVIATVAALLDMLDTLVIEQKAVLDLPVRKALFFWGIWVFLFILPYLALLIAERRLNLSALYLGSAALLVALPVGAGMRLISGYVIAVGFGVPGVETSEAGHDLLRFNADSFLFLGATWIAVTFYRGRAATARGLSLWTLIYATGAFLLGYLYAQLFHSASVDPALGVSVEAVAGGFGVLCLAVLVPGFWLAQGLFDGRGEIVLAYALLGFALCAAAGFFGLATVHAETLGQRLGFATIFGSLGALAPICVAVAAHLLRRARSETP